MGINLHRKVLKIMHTLKIWISLVCCVFLPLSLWGNLQQDISPEKRLAEFSHEKLLMLDGYDVVSYHQESGPLKGSPDFETEYKGIHYRFLNTANKDLFLEAPEKYEPLYGGWCAYAMLDGTKTEVDPKTYKIVDGKLLVFYNGLWGNTLKGWDKKLNTNTSDQSLIEQADAHWMKILSE